jgi:hypothetical protein
MVLDGLMKLQNKIQGQHVTGNRPPPEGRPPILNHESVDRAG